MINKKYLTGLLTMIITSQLTAMSSSSSSSNFHWKNNFVAIMTETLDEELAQQINECTAALANAKTEQDIKAIVSQVKKLARSHPAFALQKNRHIAEQTIHEACDNEDLKLQGLMTLERLYTSKKLQKRNSQELDAQNKKQKRTLSIDA